VLWPEHCIQGTKGAEFVPELSTNAIEAIFRKGMDKEIDSKNWSCFPSVDLRLR
jgi:nicotinamidase/pyrazinamidase